MTIFRNFVNQSHRFMAIFSNLINQGVTSHSKIKTFRYFKLRSSALAKTRSTTHTREYGLKRIKVAMKVLEESKNEFPETAKFIDDRLELECSGENITAEEVVRFLHA